MFSIVFRLLKLNNSKLRLLIFLIFLMINVLNRMGFQSTILPRFPAGLCRSPRNEVKTMKYLVLVFLGHCGSLWTVVGSLWIVPSLSGF